MHALTTDPIFLCAAAWLVSRLQIVFEVRRRIGAGFRITRYLALRWRQIAGSALSSAGALALLYVAESAEPLNALMAGAAADQVIDRFAGFLARRKRPAVPPGEAESDVTVIVRQMTGEYPAGRSEPDDDTTVER